MVKTIHQIAAEDLYRELSEIGAILGVAEDSDGLCRPLKKRATEIVTQHAYMIAALECTRQTLHNLIAGGWVGDETAVIVEHELANVQVALNKAKGLSDIR